MKLPRAPPIAAAGGGALIVGAAPGVLWLGAIND